MSNSSYSKIIGNSLIGALIGIILLVVSPIVLWWNEGNFVRNLELAKFIEENVVNVTAENVSGLNENKLVHFSGKATSFERLNDEFIQVENAVSLIRNIEMYQWKEIRENNSENVSGASENFKYTTGWDRNIISSSNFQFQQGHENPTEYTIQPKRIDASAVNVGDYVLSKKQIKQISATHKITQLPYNDKYKILNGFYFTGLDYDNPSIGDLKVSYTYVPSGISVSIIAKQVGNHIVAYKFKKGEISMVSIGNHSAQEMVNQFKSNNGNLTIVLRVLGFALIMLGLNLILNPLTALFKVFPIIRNFLVSLTWLATFLISVTISLSAISIAWIAYRPIIGIPIMLIGILILLFLPKKRHFRIGE